MSALRNMAYRRPQKTNAAFSQVYSSVRRQHVQSLGLRRVMLVLRWRRGHCVPARGVKRGKFPIWEAERERPTQCTPMRMRLARAEHMYAWGMPNLNVLGKWWRRNMLDEKCAFNSTYPQFACRPSRSGVGRAMHIQLLKYE